MTEIKVIKAIPRLNDSIFLKDCVVNENNNELIDFLKSYVDEAEENLTSGKNLLLTGSCGTGKSYILNAFKNTLGDSKATFRINTGVFKDGEWKVREVKRNITCFMTSILEMIKDLRKAYKGEETTYDYKTFDVLILDELGVQNNTNDEKKLIYDVVDFRYNHYKPTFLIANYSEEVVKSLLGERIADRLINKDTKRIVLKGKSWRL